MVASIADAQKESRRLVKHVDEKSAATITEVVKSRDGTASTLELVQSKVVSEIGRSRTETLHETEAMLQLMQLFDLVTTVPLLGGWAMEPSSMLSLVTTILQRKPELVVECGSGTSTIWLAYALAANGKGRLVSLDHEAEYASATRRAVAAHGLENIVDVRLASLVPHPIGDEQFLWYDAAQWNDLRHIDVLIVDGPPSATGPLARYPALPLLGDYLSDRALVVVDDANRKDEKTIMRRWKSELPGVGDPAHLASRTSSIEFQRVLD
jgi:predicted O-methyltransferase YrrM